MVISYIKKVFSRLDKFTIYEYGILLLIMQIVWYIILFPGCVSYDSYNQISQALGWIPFADNNPIFHTMLMSLIMRPLYLLFRDVDICIACWNMLSNLYYFFVVVYSASVFFKINTRNSFIKIIFFFYVLCPLVWGNWNILWKDIWISYSVLFLMTTIIDLLYLTKYEKNTCSLMLLFLASILTLISKGTGILFVIPLLFGLLVHYKKINKVIIIIFISILLYYVSLSFVTKCLGFAEHGNMDYMCSFWQILGKIIKDNDLSVMPEYSQLKLFIDVDKAKDLYDPYIADPIKEVIDINKFNENYISNVFLILKLAVRYAKSSLSALVFMFIGYLSPAYYGNSLWTHSYLYTVYSYAHSKWNITFDPNSLYIVSDMFSEDNRNLIHLLLNNIKHIPFLGYLYNIGFYNTIWLYCLFMCIIKKHQIMIYVIPFFCLISCVASPVSGELRYAYPMILTIPIIMIYTFCLGEK